jgi:hypothetical protein
VDAVEGVGRRLAPAVPSSITTPTTFPFPNLGWSASFHGVACSNSVLRAMMRLACSFTSFFYRVKIQFLKQKQSAETGEAIY